MYGSAKVSGALALASLLLHGASADNGVYIFNDSNQTMYYAVEQGSGGFGAIQSFAQNTGGGVANATGQGQVRISPSSEAVDPNGTNDLPPPSLYIYWFTNQDNIVYSLVSETDSIDQPYLDTLRLLTPQESCKPAPGGSCAPEPPSNSCKQIDIPSGSPAPVGLTTGNDQNYECTLGTLLYLIVEKD